MATDTEIYQAVGYVEGCLKTIAVLADKRAVSKDDANRRLEMIAKDAARALAKLEQI